MKVDFSQEPSEEIAGYFATIELINGFKKLIFWGYDKVYSHGKRFSKSFNNGPWKTDFDAMAQKTLLKALISVYAPLSQEMEKAVIFDAETEDKMSQPVDVTPDTSPDTLSDLIGTNTPEVTESSEPIEDLGVMVQPGQQTGLGIEDF